jgi:hypothetical protein
VNDIRSKVRTLALFVFPVGAGATLPDIDHILPPYKRAWGHIWIMPCLILFIVVVAFISGWVKIRILKKST